MIRGKGIYMFVEEWTSGEVLVSTSSSERFAESGPGEDKVYEWERRQEIGRR